MEYRRLSGTDLLFKRDPQTGQWIPIDEQNTIASPLPDEEATTIQPYQAQPLTEHPPPTDATPQGVQAGFATLATALKGQFYAGSHTDRARGFLLRTSLLSLLGLFSGIFYALVVRQAPFLSMTLFASIMLGLIAAWLLAYLSDKLSAPETVTLILALGLLGWLRRERKERWGRYDE